MIMDGTPTDDAGWEKLIAHVRKGHKFYGGRGELPDIADHTLRAIIRSTIEWLGSEGGWSSDCGNCDGGPDHNIQPEEDET